LAGAKNRIEFLMLSFSKSDKVLVVAPHPDDESLGVGGLLQRIFAQKVPVRILFATNGDNNPWAQRYWERTWVIGDIERTRWGQRRREEALRAIGVLGGTSESAKFLDLPDLGTTDLLMKGAAGLSGRVAAEIRESSYVRRPPRPQRFVSGGFDGAGYGRRGSNPRVGVPGT
jgi:LmbE family N-acetylglucosaminyl deacetylase